MNLLDRMCYDTGGYTVQEILSSFTKKILEIIDLVNKNEEVCDEAHTIIENIRNEVVPELVNDIMKEMQDKGYFDSLVNVTLIEQLRTELTTLLNDAITDYTTRLDNIVHDIKEFGVIGDGIVDDTLNYKKAVSIENIKLNISNLTIKLTEEVRHARGVILTGNNKSTIVLSGAGHDGLFITRNCRIDNNITILADNNFNGSALTLDTLNIYENIGENDYGYSVKVNVENIKIARKNKPTLQDFNCVGLRLLADTSHGGALGFWGANFKDINISNFPTGIKLEGKGNGSWINSNLFENIFIDSPINGFIADTGKLNNFKNIIIQCSEYTQDIVLDNGSNRFEYTSWDTHLGVNGDDDGIQQGYSKFSCASDNYRYLYSSHVTLEVNKYTKLGSINVGNQLRQQYVRFRLSNAYCIGEFLLYWDGTKFNLNKVIIDETSERFRDKFSIHYKKVRDSYIIYTYNTHDSQIGNIYNFTLLDGGNFLLDSAVGGVTFENLRGLTKATEKIVDKYKDLSKVVEEGVFTFNSGFLYSELTPQIRKNNKCVTLYLPIKGNSVFNQNEVLTVGTLPIGFRPKNSMVTLCGISNDDWDITEFGYCYISTNGSVQIRTKSPSMQYAKISLSFIVD